MEIDEDRHDDGRLDGFQRHADGLDVIVFVEIADDEDDLTQTNAIRIVGLATQAMAHQLGDGEALLLFGQQARPIGGIEIGGRAQRRDREGAEEFGILGINRCAAGEKAVEQAGIIGRDEKVGVQHIDSAWICRRAR